MPPSEATKYYESRRQAALMMSEAALESSIRNIHLDLARRYSERIFDTVQETSDSFPDQYGVGEGL